MSQDSLNRIARIECTLPTLWLDVNSRDFIAEKNTVPIQL